MCVDEDVQRHSYQRNSGTKTLFLNGFELCSELQYILFCCILICLDKSADIIYYICIFRVGECTDELEPNAGTEMIVVLVLRSIYSNTQLCSCRSST